MNTSAAEKITLPALRGLMGNWVYYSCLINLKELSKRVHYAQDIHKSQHLSDMIQRQLNRNRAPKIARYLRTQPERFFNSLVIATYGGQPNWHALSSLRPKSESSELENLEQDTLESVGFLTLRGDEKLFAIDGQHRLAGIKKAVSEGLDQDPIDEVSVIFVAHKATARGLERTRRLFTTLNKTARPVSKGDIIALDEDDVMAICVRRLIEETSFFSGNKIAFVASNNVPPANTESITTIGNLYDVLAILFTESESGLKNSKLDLMKARPDEETLEKYFALAKTYLALLEKAFDEVGAFFSAIEPAPIVKKYRGNHGGSAIFRPIGFEIYTRIASRLTKEMSLEEAVHVIAKLPRNISAAPYRGLMWDPSNKTITNAHKVTLREILMYMTGVSKLTDSTLRLRYRKELGDDNAELPQKVI